MDSLLRILKAQFKIWFTAEQQSHRNPDNWNNQLLNKCAHFRQNRTWRSSFWNKNQEKDYLTYASSFPFSSGATLSLWIFSRDWHPMARYWATSGWTRLSICVLLDGSISSLCSAKCASAVSAALCWLVNERYTIKSHPQLVCEWAAAVPGLSLTHGVGSLRACFRFGSLHVLRQKSRVPTGPMFGNFNQIISLVPEGNTLRGS